LFAESSFMIVTPTFVRSTASGFKNASSWGTFAPM
jgi:hypothetical protein